MLQKINQVIQGGQTLLHTLRMLGQIARILLAVGVVSFGLVFSAYVAYGTPPSSRALWGVWVKAQLYDALLPKVPMPVKGQQRTYRLYAKDWLTLSQAKAIGKTLQVGLLFTVWSVVGEMGLILVVLGWLGARGRRSTFIDGIFLATPQKLRRALTQQGPCEAPALATLPMPQGGWQQHVLVHGSTGTGKTQVLQALCEELRALGDKVIVYDPHGSFLPYFYDEARDILLNPFDTRCAPWDWWADCQDSEHHQVLAKALIPETPAGTDPFWVIAARTVLVAIAQQLEKVPERTMSHLIMYCRALPLDVLVDVLKKSNIDGIVSLENEKTASSIRSVLSTYVEALTHVTHVTQGVDAKGAFSLRQYIAATDNRGWCFVTSRADKHQAIAPLLTVWLELVANSVLSLPETKTQRTWVILDELPSLQKLPCLEPLLAQSRKFGGCCVLSMQNIQQCYAVYGVTRTKAMVDLCNSRVFFRSPSHEIADWVSRELGLGEWEEVQQGVSYGANTVRDGVTLQRHRVQRPAVSATMLKRLPNLHAVVNIPALREEASRQKGWPIAKVRLRYQARPSSAPALIEKKDKKEEEAKEDVMSQETLDHLMAELPDTVKKKRAMGEKSAFDAQRREFRAGVDLPELGE